MLRLFISLTIPYYGFPPHEREWSDRSVREVRRREGETSLFSTAVLHVETCRCEWDFFIHDLVGILSENEIAVVLVTA